MNPRLSNFWARMKAHRLASTFLILLTLALGILIGTVISQGVKGQSAKNVSADATPISLPSPQQLSTAFSQIAKQIEPAVVNINTEGIVRNPHRRRSPRPGPGTPESPEDNPFQDFFDRFFGGPGGQGFGPEEQRTTSLGSGVIVDPKGYIITNRHVVDRADRIRVRLHDDPVGFQGYEAKVIGTDVETDLAVIKIDVNKPLTAAKLGNSDSMQVGDWVLAIGSPFSLEATVTAGIVSATSRNNIAQQFQDFIQTDAAINPGNSGGPLVNMRNEVIGINTAIFTESGGYQGVGFALPSNTVAYVYNQLIGPEHRVTRGSIGVTFQPALDPAAARVYGLKNGGVIISEIAPGGPAEKAGLQVGDAITAIDGKPLKSGDDLVADVSRRKPGTHAKVSYVRNGKEQTATLTIADRTKLFGERLGLAQEEGEGPESPAPTRMGVTIRAVTPDMAQKLGLQENRGVLVQDVKVGSFADDIGLTRGDLILEINRQRVNSEDDFRRITSAIKPGQDVAMLVRRGRGQQATTLIVAGTLPQEATGSNQ